MSQVKNTSEIKNYNINLIRDCLIEGEVLTKKTIAERTGLSLATCTSMLAELIESGIVNEMELDVPHGGRPARRFCINVDYSHVLCIYADNNYIYPRIFVRVYDYKGNILTDYIKDVHTSLAVGAIRTVMSEVLAKDNCIKMVSLGIPGITDENGTVEICDFDGLIGMNLKSILEDEFGVEVYVGNDMYFTSYGCYLLSDRKKPFSLNVSIWPEVQISGAGSVINGVPLVGASNFAGEISRILFLSGSDGRKRADERNLTANVGAHLVCCAAIINPDVVYLAGRALENSNAQEFKEWTLKYIPEKHMPEIIVKNDIHEEYLTGMFVIGRKVFNGDNIA